MVYLRVSQRIKKPLRSNLVACILMVESRQSEARVDQNGEMEEFALASGIV